MSESDKKERRIQNEMQNCVHFNGVQHDRCKAGVSYHALHGTGAGCFAALTCLGEDSRVKRDREAPLCTLKQLPTREKVEADLKSEAEMFDKTVTAMHAAKADAKAKGLGVGNGGSSQIECPLGCGGNLRYRVAGVNGHMHAACENGCGNWME